MEDIRVRDELIAAQEALLNVYRCRFDIDTEIVPGGCVNSAPASSGQPDGTGSGAIVLHGTGSDVRTVTLPASRYQVDAEVSADDDYFTFSVTLFDDEDRCASPFIEFVDEDTWVGIVVLTLGNRYFGCAPGKLLMEVDTDAKATWQITYTPR